MKRIGRYFAFSVAPRLIDRSGDWDVPVIDLHAMSKALVEPMGEKESMEKMACDSKDHTHFSPAGAKMMADLVMNELPAAAPVLKSHLKAGTG